MKAPAFLGLAALAMASSARADAPSPWTLSGSMRLRYEALDGQVRPGFNASDDLISLRTIVTGEYRRGPLRLGAEMYDSRAWGANRRSSISTGEVNTFELVQAYAALDGKTEALGPVSLQAGRFTLNLGSRRLVAADDYRNTTNGFTGVRLDLAPAGVRTTLIYAQPQVRRPDSLDALLDNRHRADEASRHLVLFGGTAARPKSLGDATVEGTYLRLEESDAPGRPTRNRRLDSYGVRVIRDPAAGRWDYEIEAIGQGGTIRRGLGAADPTLKVRAHFLHAEAGYTWDRPWRPHVSAEFDLATGDKAGGRFGRFDSLFGTRRGDLAPSGIYNAIGRANIVTPGLRLEVTPSPRWDGFVAVRGLWLEAREDAFSTTGVRDPAGASGRFAGRQLEGRVRYWLVPGKLRAEANGVWLDKARFLRRAPNAPPTGDERYVSLNLTGQF